MQQKRMLQLEGSHVSQICQSTPVINYSDQRNRRGGSEKEGLKTSISICNHPPRQRGGKRDKRRERSPEGETCHISTEA